MIQKMIPGKIPSMIKKRMLMYRCQMMIIIQRRLMKSVMNKMMATLHKLTVIVDVNENDSASSVDNT